MNDNHTPDATEFSFEYPMGERMRLFLRLEFLSTLIGHHLTSPSPWNSHAALSGMIDFLAVIERSDVKSDVLKELEKHQIELKRWQQQPGVDPEKIQALSNELRSHADTLQHLKHKVGQRLRHNDLIAMLKQRLAIPGGTCSFDIPAYHCWLLNDPEQRSADLQGWFSEINSMSRAINLILKLTRESSATHSKIALGGFFQQALETSKKCQLVRVNFAKSLGVFPEISGGKHRINIRFLVPHPEQEKAQQTTSDINFTLTFCGS